MQYDLDDLDLNWLESVNQKRKFRGQSDPHARSLEQIMASFQYNMLCLAAGIGRFFLRGSHMK